MPEDFDKALRQFVFVFNAITAPSPVASQYPNNLVHSQDPGMDLNIAYGDVIRAARKHMGTDPLSKEVSRTLGLHTVENPPRPDAEKPH